MIVAKSGMLRCHQGMCNSEAGALVVSVLCPSLQARLAQSAERKALNLVVVGSSPTVGVASLLPGRRMSDASVPPQEFEQ